MKRFLTVCIFLMLFSTGANAETMYVSDIIQITMRTGQGIDHRIVAMLNSGEEVEILEAGAQWTRVRIQNGKEGWVLTRYLTPKKPSGLLLETLEKKHAEVTVAFDEIKKENSALKADNKRLAAELSANERALSEVTRSYETLMAESAEFLKLRSSFDESAAQLSEQKVRVEKYEEELTRLQFHQNIKWFLAGAGVLILGFVVGFSARRQRRKSSFL
jgi:SH3 domain protein